MHLVQDDGEGVDVALGAVAVGVPQALRGAVEVVETRGRVLGRLIIIFIVSGNNIFRRKNICFCKNLPDL